METRPTSDKSVQRDAPRALGLCTDCKVRFGTAPDGLCRRCREAKKK